MKCIAKFPQGQFGFWNNHRVYDGDELVDVTDETFSSTWMVRVIDGEVDEVEPKAKRKKEVKEPRDPSRIF